MSDAEFQYLTGQARPGFPALFEEFERRSADAVRHGDCQLDLRYGMGERCTYDFFDGGPFAPVVAIGGAVAECPVDIFEASVAVDRQ